MADQQDEEQAEAEVKAEAEEDTEAEAEEEEEGSLWFAAVVTGQRLELFAEQSELASAAGRLQRLIGGDGTVRSALTRTTVVSM